MKIFGVVVLYNPQKDMLGNTIYLSQFVEKLYLVDNSESGEQREVLSLLPPHVEYIPFGDNKGVAYALNFVAQKAFSKRSNLASHHGSG